MDLDFQTLPDLLVERVKYSPDQPAFLELNSNGKWESITWKNFSQQVDLTAARLLQHGVKANDCVGILLSNCIAWEIIHHALLRLGVITVGFVKTDPPARLNEIFNNSQIVGIFAEDIERLNFLSQQQVEALRIAVSFSPAKVTGWVWWDDFNSSSADPSTLPPLSSPQQAATLIYTSGTTGPVKGILYTQMQLTMAIKSISDVYKDFLEERTKFISWLPLSALSQRIANLCAIIFAGEVYFLADPKQIMDVIKPISPGFFIGVPYFYEKLSRGINNKIKESPVLVRVFIYLAIGVGKLYARRIREHKKINWLLKISHCVADKLVLSKIRGVMGHNLKYMLSGSSSMPIHLLEFFHAIGLTILEAYGLSENIIPIAMNTKDCFRFGTVGKVLKENDIKFDSESTILVRGPGIFSGYHRAEDPKTFTQEGYYDTGDYGELKDGFLILKGRRSELIKISTGHRISSVHVETALKTFSLINQAVVFGFGHKRLIALITLNLNEFDVYHIALDQWQQPPEALLKDLTNGLMKVAQSLAIAEQPAGYIVLEKPFSAIRGEITSSQKLCRENIEQRYALWINRLFDEIDVRKDFMPRFVFLSDTQIQQSEFV